MCQFANEVSLYVYASIFNMSRIWQVLSVCTYLSVFASDCHVMSSLSSLLTHSAYVTTQCVLYMLDALALHCI